VKRKKLPDSESSGYDSEYREKALLEEGLGNLNGRLAKLVDELVSQGLTLEQARQEFERQFIMASLRSNDWNLCRSARSLGLHRNTLRNKVSNLGISVASARSRARSARWAL
jgi:DNA-binding NtrC family response regulator